ncbi:cytochrome P450 7B1 [Scophthalmus maximus]|uniref:25-hydroxycholesterol 7-alpha-hydroxylase n=1 Tax=Scophthalmus maximus TaxID=52904 RepID=A0A6A4TIA6_SCOMX|nr:cytochrome P450 7B1 [Scophthalmus maximus]KAF0046447.1 hypothetical protein F2P81_000080 [Scophthalmus maximus]
MSPLLLLGLGLLLLLGLGLLLRRRNRRDGEPPLITGWIPVVGKALEFGRNSYKFLEEHKKKFGDIFTVQIAGKYMTFIMNPLMYPNIIKHGRQLDFHEFAKKIGPIAFGYQSGVYKTFPGLHEKIQRAFLLLQGDNLPSLTESMMGNLLLVFRQDHLGERPGEEGPWRSSSLYKFCNSVLFEATFLTMYGRPPSTSRHNNMEFLRENFTTYDNMFPLLAAQIPIWLLGQTKAVREKLINVLLPQKVSCWSNTSQFIKRRSEILDQVDPLTEFDKGAHHFAILWASVANTVPASFWTLYYLVSHPDALERVRKEIKDVLVHDRVEFSSDRDVSLSIKQLDKLLYLESAIKESLRLSSSSMNIRMALEDFTLQLSSEWSEAIRKGDFIVLYPQCVHMDPQIYEDPETFQFDRFMQDGKEKTDFYKDGQKLKYYLVPFGTGSSKCPGRFFAINEIKQFLCMLLLYFDVQLEEGQVRPGLDYSRAGLGILPPTDDVLFRYRLRTAAPGPKPAQ